jgi:hypothetical protein
VTLDIDDTVDRVHGHEQLALFNAHYDERFLPIYVYDTATSRPVAVLLRLLRRIRRPHRCNAPGSAEIVQTLPGGQNDAYRSQKTVKVDGHLGNVG